MGNKLYVGGLAWAMRDESLKEAFEAYGPVAEAKIIMDRETGRSRGFGFVTFENDDDAEKALAMDQQELEGRTIRVNFARERAPRGPGGGGGGRRW